MSKLDLKQKVQALDDARASKKTNATTKKRVKTLVKDTVIDNNTGEVVSDLTTQQTTVSDSSHPPFVKLFINDLMLINELPSKASGVLYELVRRTSYDNKIVLNSAIKRELCEKLDIKSATLNNTLSSFVKKEILYRLDTGIYMPNPYLFARGEWSDIFDLRMVVNYKPNGTREVKAQIDGVDVAQINKDFDNVMEGN